MDHLKQPVTAVLLVTVLAWSMPAAAFCFSMGGGSRNNNAGYYAPPVMPGFGAGWYPASTHALPVLPASVLPVANRGQRLPAASGDIPQQHIFR